MLRSFALFGLVVLTTACSGGDVCPGGAVLDGDLCDWDHHDWCIQTRFGADGTATDRTDATYDGEGRLASRTGWRAPSDPGSEWLKNYVSTWSYEGEVTVVDEDEEGDGQVDVRYRYTYEEGLLVRSERDDGLDGNLEALVIMEYDAFQRLVRVSAEYDEGGGAPYNVVETSTWTGDPEDGLETRTVEVSDEEGISQRYEWERDKGVLLASRYGTGDEGWDQESTWEMKQQGVPLSRTMTTWSGSVYTDTYAYDDDRLVRVTGADADGGPTYEQRHARDDQGRLIEWRSLTEGVTELSFTRTYDCF